jgi:hypothetical protein
VAPGACGFRMTGAELVVPRAESSATPGRVLPSSHVMSGLDQVIRTRSPRRPRERIHAGRSPDPSGSVRPSARSESPTPRPNRRGPTEARRRPSRPGAQSGAPRGSRLARRGTTHAPEPAGAATRAVPGPPRVDRVAQLRHRQARRAARDRQNALPFLEPVPVVSLDGRRRPVSSGRATRADRRRRIRARGTGAPAAAARMTVAHCSASQRRRIRSSHAAQTRDHEL